MFVERFTDAGQVRQTNYGNILKKEIICMVIDEALQNRKIPILRLNLVLALAEGLIVIWFFLREPSESQSAVLLGFSVLRLILLLAVLGLLLVVLSLLVNSFRRSWWNRGVGQWTLNAMDRTLTWQVLLFWAGLMYLSLFLSEAQMGSLSPYRERSLPMLAWSAAVSFQLILSVVYFKSIGSNVLRQFRDVLLPAFVALALLGLFIVFVAVTGLGLDPDPIYWQWAGVPILLTQVLLAVVAGLMVYSLLNRLKISRSSRLDRFISVGLWALTSLLWLSQPARPSYTSLAPSPPNYQSYPFGDAIIYDIAAHDYLIGKPIPSEFGVKPLYSFFLALLHLFAGENYTLLISLQIIVLAVVPVLVYLLTVSLSNRAAGLVAAILVIVRERNGIALSNVIEVSHTKLLLSDTFAMGLMILLLLLFFRWLEKPEVRRGTLIAMGGVLSLLCLTRGHPIILVPLVFCLFLLVTSLPLRLRLQCALLFAVGAAVPLIPWFWRNYEAHGEFTFQDPVSRYTTHIAGLYTLDQKVPARLNGETDSEYYDRLSGQPLQFMLQHPGEVAKFVSAHYFHNSILSYVYLPHSFRIESLRAYVKTEPFWRDWAGELQVQEWILLWLNLAVIALGFGTSWKKQGFYSLIPLLVGIGYNVSVSIGRLSGWRFIQPSDWVTLVFYSIGLVQLSFILRFVLVRPAQNIQTDEEPEFQANEKPGRWTPVWGVIAAFFLIAWALTYGHELFFSRYPAKSAPQLIDTFQELTASMPDSLTDEALNNFFRTDNAMIAYGEALYPAFFESDAGAYNHYLLSYQAKPYDRVVLHLSGPQSIGVILPMRSAPARFADGAEVIVLGCRSDAGIVDAVSLLVVSDPPILYNRDPMPDLTCPLPEAE
ncbi:MAG: hypothetical protein AB1607_03010 [Chloroflexota bacterium]